MISRLEQLKRKQDRLWLIREICIVFGAVSVFVAYGVMLAIGFCGG